MPETCGTCRRRTDRGACHLYLPYAYVDCNWWEPAAPDDAPALDLGDHGDMPLREEE